MSRRKKGIDIIPSKEYLESQLERKNYVKPDRELKTWVEIFDYQARKDGANYYSLMIWLDENYNPPTIKK